MSIIENYVSTFIEDWQLYRNEIYLKALAKHLKPIICNTMVCLNIFRGGVVTCVCLVCLFVYLTFYSFFILFIFRLVKLLFFKTQEKKCKVL
jgi:hypothetical protein